MKIKDKKEHLKNSPLFNSLLSGNEIRYSDIIGYFIEKYQFNPFKNKKITVGFNVYREKMHTDLWITSIENSENLDTVEDSICETPIILIENKLKSLSNNQQLKDYTEIFINSYIDSFKAKLRKQDSKIKSVTAKMLLTKKEIIEKELTKLEFYVLLPIKPHNNKKKEMIGIDVSKINCGKPNPMKFEWAYITYDKLGNNIKKYIDAEYRGKGTDSNDYTKEVYLKEFFIDFARILNSFSLLSSGFKDLKKNDSIIKTFETPKIFKELKMDDLYAKYRASQCAEELSLMLDRAIISNSPFKTIEANKTYIHTSFSRKSSLFEVKTKINNSLIYVIQYQAGVLKKGLVVKTENASKYYDWFKTSWDLNGHGLEPIKIEFEIKDEGGELDEDKFYKYSVDKKLTFYYSIYSIKQKRGKTKLTVNDVLSLMKVYINDKSFMKINKKKD